VSLAGRLVAVGASIGLASTTTSSNSTSSTSSTSSSSTGTLASTGIVGRAGTELVGPDGTAQAAELLREADLAMYEAKDRNGSCVQVFAPAMSQAVLRSAQLQQDLAQALAAGQLWIALQPIVDLRTGASVGAEALLR